MAKAPESVASCARRCDSAENASMSSRRDAPLVGQDLGDLELRHELPVDHASRYCWRERARGHPTAFEAIGTRLIDSTPQAMARS